MRKFFKKLLIQYEHYNHGVYEGMRQTYGIGHQVNGHWEGDACKDQAKCITWTPLPKPYNEH